MYLFVSGALRASNACKAAVRIMYVHALLCSCSGNEAKALGCS
jgi:hypothetical protein